MHIFAARSIGHKPLHFWHHFLQKHFTHLVLLFLPRSFFFKFKLFSLRHNRQDSKFDTFPSCWFGIGSPTVGVSKKPVHVKYFSTSCLTSDHKCLSSELTNSERGKRRRIPKYNEDVTRKGKSFVRLSSVYQKKSLRSVSRWALAAIISICRGSTALLTTNDWPAPDKNFLRSKGKARTTFCDRSRTDIFPFMAK